MPTLKPEIKAKWVAALRSGEYAQYAGGLRINPTNRPAGFCCLGVLCDLHAKEGLGEWENLVYAPAAKAGRSGYLPAEVVQWAVVPEAFEAIPVGCRAVSGTPVGPFAVSGPEGTRQTVLPDSFAVRLPTGMKTLNDMNDEGMTFEQVAAAIEAQL